MFRRERLVLGVSLAACAGVTLLFGSVLWGLWRTSLASEAAMVGGLALTLGERTERIILDTRDLLAGFDELPESRCSRDHLRTLEDAAVSRPHLRGIGHWRAARRLCGVGFLETRELKPPRASRIYDSGVIAWWPSRHTEVGGVPLFIMRYGDHDAVIDPRRLLEVGPLTGHQVALWVENLQMAAYPLDADLPAPDTLPIGVRIDRAAGQVVSRFSHNALLPIDVVAIEPLASFWDRHLLMLAVGSAVGLVLAGGWMYGVLHFSRRRLSLAGELRQAIARGRIRVQYQPIVELETGRCVGAEALARWTRYSGEAVPPDVFIPLAEKEGLVSSITLAALTEVVRDLRPLLAQAPSLSINVNVCPDDLRGDRFAEALAAQLRDAGLPPSAVKLEITERALGDIESARTMIHTFRERGHRIAVDDFGTGYSSLSHLETFELDVLKIDKTFVDAIGTTSRSSQVIGHVIEMARSLKLETVAEGVENEIQRRWLMQHGVEFGQGFLFSRPLGAEAFIDYLRERSVG